MADLSVNLCKMFALRVAAVNFMQRVSHVLAQCWSAHMPFFSRGRYGHIVACSSHLLGVVAGTIQEVTRCPILRLLFGADSVGHSRGRQRTQRARDLRSCR